MNDKPPLPPLSDSPWFWVYTFGTFALILLVLIGPKFDERRGQGKNASFKVARERSSNAWGEEPTVELSTPGRTLLSLRPLYVVLGLMIAAGWTILWWQRWRTRSAVANLSEPSPPVPPEKARP